MAHDGFPRDDYTPYGLLANPYAVAHSWHVGSGGVIRSSREGIGFGWVYPWALGAEACAELRVDVWGGERRLFGDASSAGEQPRATHHSARLIELAWTGFGYRWTASFVLVARDELGLEVTAERVTVRSPVEHRSEAAPDRTIQIEIGLYAWRRPSVEGAPPGLSAGGCDAAGADSARGRTSPPFEHLAGSIGLGAPYGVHRLYVDVPAGAPAIPAWDARSGAGANSGSSDTAGTAYLSLRLALAETHAAGVVLRAILRRQPDDEARAPPAIGVSERVSAALERARAEDDVLWSGGARLEGDWPVAWRRGWVYDLETTRMCVFPTGGVFADVWPSWMVQWPRAVVAEGTLDMVRLA